MIRNFPQLEPHFCIQLFYFITLSILLLGKKGKTYYEMHTLFSLWFEYDMSFTQVCILMVWSLGVTTIWGGSGNVGSQDCRKHVTGLKSTLGALSSFCLLFERMP